MRSSSALKSFSAPEFSISKSTWDDRLNKLSQRLSEADLETLFGLPSRQVAETLIEAPVGYMPLSLGFVHDLVVNRKSYMIPMATEESSVVAALNNMAKWSRTQGHLMAQSTLPIMVGQIFITPTLPLTRLIKKLNQYQSYFLQMVNESVLASLVRRGGGAMNIELRTLDKGICVLHLGVNVCDAMGANLVTQACEFLKPLVMAKLQCQVKMCILSNFCDQNLATAVLNLEKVDLELGEAIEEASYFAQVDPYRATTHNKGIMNGVDAVAIATGNDWRAVEAACHAYAVRDGRYRGLSSWKMSGSTLSGTLTLPLSVGIVGGVTNVHPTAQACLKMMGVKSSRELAQVMTAVGLLQNLGALKALVSGGVVQGHMRLHISNLVAEHAQTAIEQKWLHEQLQETLRQQGFVTATHAKDLLKRLKGA